MSVESKLSILVLVAALLGTVAMAAEETGRYTVNISTNATLGKYLVNETGFTLYYFTKDAPGNGTSTCYGNCSKLWPPFYAENITVPEGLDAKDFTAVNRTDGEEQIAYKGWPLYFWYKDMKAGDTLGQGVGKIWYVVNPEDFPPKT